ncbi:Cas1p-domain-containing protein [Fistulina hepatica ATCC 64428]|uniref:Cas1p-domain-containing protein n=1 Tax=Fistulina hepatica ATCC 64428 TaxID=1128425 RepID=A0A0D7AGY1_9AGAR|nr:Cas1p-domain-containing protein [Fistulina hepatica ATCC 64428]
MADFSLNFAQWAHAVSWLALTIALLLGLGRTIVFDRTDPIHCNALLQRGTWLDSAFKNWQPDGCMSHKYSVDDASSCLKGQKVVFVGDSVTRTLFYQFANLLDPKLPTGPPDDNGKHADYTILTSSGIQISFYWDPYLNGTHLRSIISDKPQVDASRPGLLVVGGGLWYLRYPESGGLSAWEGNIQHLVTSLAGSSLSSSARDIVVLPVEDVVPSKLSSERANVMRLSDIDAMNADLAHRIFPVAEDSVFSLSLPAAAVPIALPSVFNAMLDPSQTQDGLHFSDVIVRAQANLLLNYRCNEVLPKKFPLDKTCCRRYPSPSFLHSLILLVLVMWGPYLVLVAHKAGGHGRITIRSEELPAVIFSAATALVYIADRTGFWLKEQKQFNSWTFTAGMLAIVASGFAKVKVADGDLGYLNRDQTDEWKGWMQLVILVYHYLGASKVSGIYNLVRVIVAAYLFMTGYGHTTFYIRKADFGFLRIAQVLVRLNLFTILLAYVMNTDYISYYFSPLVSLWFVVIYATMALGATFNESTPFLVMKFIISAGVMTWLMTEEWPMNMLFEILQHFCGIRWSAREWRFRVTLDLWIVYVGMFTALAVIKIQKHRLTDHPKWPLVVKSSIVASALTMVWYFAFELWQEDKFVYNKWHPYISFLPVLAFTILRNATPLLRSVSFTAFAWVGKCSLETFIIQFHFWLAADTKGILLVLPGTWWRPLNFLLTSIVFLYLSHQVSEATGQITKWICGSTKKPASLPTAAPEPRREVLFDSRGEQSVPLMERNGDASKDQNAPSLVAPAAQPGRWLNRLANSPPTPHLPSLNSWKGPLGVKGKLAIGVVAMWICNLLWSYDY